MSNAKSGGGPQTVARPFWRRRGKAWAIGDMSRGLTWGGGLAVAGREGGLPQAHYGSRDHAAPHRCAMQPPWETFKLLADATRLRLVALLREEELSVAELQEVLDLGQSRISTHLATLRQGGAVEDRKDGKRTYYRLGPALLQADAARLLEAALATAASQPELRRDAAARRRARERRRAASERYFNEVAGRLGKGYCPGRSWEGIARLFLELTPALDIADLGAGEGHLSHLLARRARQVYCIDHSPAMVEVGTAIAQKHGLANVQYSLGDIEAVPLPEASVDIALLSQALHHAIRPARALAEAFRILRPGGRLLMLDLKEHTFEKARELYADVWLGFSEAMLHEELAAAGFSRVEIAVVAREPQEPFFETLFATGEKAAGANPVAAVQN